MISRVEKFNKIKLQKNRSFRQEKRIKGQYKCVQIYNKNKILKNIIIIKENRNKNKRNTIIMRFPTRYKLVLSWLVETKCKNNNDIQDKTYHYYND